MFFYFIKKIYKYKKYGQFTRNSIRDTIGASLLNIKPIKKEYEKEIIKYHDDACKKNIDKWKTYGPLFTQIPNNEIGRAHV